MSSVQIRLPLCLTLQLPSSGYRIFTHHFLRYFCLVIIGFANGLPIPLAGSVLSIWLVESNFDKSTIGLFALLGIPFSFKIIWKPIIDRYGSRKGWVLISLLGMAFALLGMSFIEPAQSPGLLSSCLLALSIFSGALYIAGILYELESLEEKSYSLGSACAVTGYRLGLLCAGAGALYFSVLWDWSWMFRLMALLLVLGGVVIALRPEPFKSGEIIQQRRLQLAQYPSLSKAFWQETIVRPCRSFFRNQNWRTIAILLITFKIGDQLAKSMEGPFYLSIGFSKVTIASASKMWGMAASISGAFLAGVYLRGRDPFLTLAQAGFIHACSLVCYLLLSLKEATVFDLYLTVAIENFTGGAAMTAFIHFLWRVCDKQYAAIQYALLWSVFSFKGDLLAPLGGLLAENYSWTSFFVIVSMASGLTAMLAWLIAKKANSIACTKI